MCSSVRPCTIFGFLVSSLVRAGVSVGRAVSVGRSPLRSSLLRTSCERALYHAVRRTVAVYSRTCLVCTLVLCRAPAPFADVVRRRWRRTSLVTLKSLSILSAWLRSIHEHMLALVSSYCLARLGVRLNFFELFGAPYLSFPFPRWSRLACYVKSLVTLIF